MVEALLVASERESVAKLAAGLDAHKLDVRIVVLAKFEEYSESKIVLASPAFDQHRSLFNYVEFGAILRQIGLDEEVPYPLILKMQDPVVVALQQSPGPIESARGLHIGLRSLGDRYLEDGYVFRVRA